MSILGILGRGTEGQSTCHFVATNGTFFIIDFFFFFQECVAIVGKVNISLSVYKSPPDTAICLNLGLRSVKPQLHRLGAMQPEFTIGLLAPTLGATSKESLCK